MISVFFTLLSVWFVLSVLFVLWMMRAGATVIALFSILVALAGLAVGLWLGNRLAPCDECVVPSDGAFVGGIVGLFTGSLLGSAGGWALKRP